jgi:hypothetical protein
MSHYAPQTFTYHEDEQLPSQECRKRKATIATPGAREGAVTGEPWAHARTCKHFDIEAGSNKSEQAVPLRLVALGW